jgi:hypothetical protein
MTKEQKDWIDNASYEQLLRKWRFAPLGDKMFQGVVGDYYAMVMSKKRSEDEDAAIQSSKRIGWEK